MSFLSRLSLANKSIVALATIAILLFGAVVIPSLKRELLPSIAFPAVSVVSVYPGASPASVEQDVTNPLEKNFQGIAGLQQLTSFSNEGVSIIIAEYDFNTDLDKASQNLTQLISKTQSSLPANVTPQVQTFNISDQPIIRLAVTSSANQQDLATQLNQNVVPVLQGIDGVANVTLTGVRNQIVTVALDLKKLQDNGLSVTQVQGALQANNLTLPAGEVNNNDQTVAIRVGNTLNSLDDLKNLVVGLHTSIPAGVGGGTTIPGIPGRTGQGAFNVAPSAPPTPVRLKDVATVTQDLAPSTTLTRTNGKPSLGLLITKTSSGNTVTISQAINDKLPDLEKQLGSDAKITVISDQAPTIQSSINDLVREGLVGAGFAILVILLFLLSIRSTLVTAISIPLSVVIALIGLWVGNYSLNVLTLGGLTIAIGRVVDDSIVVLENIYRHMHLGEDKLTAVLQGVREVAGAITASTITTVAVFLPIAFTTGIVGEFFQPFSIAVTVALLASLFVALTIIPVLAYWFMKPPKRRQEQNGHERLTILERAYIPLVRTVTRFRVLTLLVALLLLVGTFSLYPFLETNLFGNATQNTFSINLQLPASSSLERTDAAAQKVENVLAGIQGIQTYQVTVGSNGSVLSLSSSGSNSASFAVTTDPNADQNAIQQKVRDQLKNLTDIGTFTLSSQGGGGNNSAIAVNVQANDDQTLRQATQQVFNAVSQAPDLTDVTSSLTDAAPLIDVRVDAQKAASHGMTAAQVGQTLRDIYTGTTVTHVTLNGTLQDVDLKLGTPANTVQGIQDMLIPTTTGNVRLGDLADVTQTTGPTQITHIATNRTATINATVTSQNVGAVSIDVQNRVNKLSLPSGATVSLGGVTTQQQQAFQSLGLALLAAIVLVYVVMVATFRSLLQPLILMIAIPFAATGSILLLLATHTALGLPSLIGVLMLVGIVVTNAIVLLDLVNQYRNRGLDARAAVVEGGRRRVRPILMTAIATILALIPMALNLGGSSGFLSGPLAIVVIGGLTSSTFLTLLIVPTLYVIVEDIRERSRRKQPAVVGQNGAVVVESDLQRALMLEEEYRQLKQEVESLRQERDVLKKAIAIFSRGNM
ncbi:MAG TPA: efflux RND transporter permease subunit [Ktedonobacteraceae bacterium]|nr:efflux RND transporter permease subunit [Ktedonobacteraceae bacterium]